MDDLRNDGDVLESLRSHLDGLELSLNEKLPVERELAETLGLSRHQLRKALSALEQEGKIWRQVGRGTFIGPRYVNNLNDVQFLTNQTSPKEVMEARLSIEPQIARLASLNGAEADFREIARCNARCRKAEDWRTYEVWDINFHRAIALATHNKVLINLFETLNLVRRATVWEMSRESVGPPKNYKSFEEHERIHDAIARRDPDGAADALRSHLGTVRARFQRILQI